MLDLFRGSVRPPPIGSFGDNGARQPSAKRSKRSLGFFAHMAAGAPVVAGAMHRSTVDSVVPTAASSELLVWSGRKRGVKRAGHGRDRQFASDSKLEVEEEEEKVLEEDASSPSRVLGPSVVSSDDGSVSDVEPSAPEGFAGSLFDRLVCLSLHPMYRSSARYMRQLYTILGDVADRMAGFGARQAELDSVALRDFVLVRAAAHLHFYLFGMFPFPTSFLVALMSSRFCCFGGYAVHFCAVAGVVHGVWSSELVLVHAVHVGGPVADPSGPYGSHRHSVSCCVNSGSALHACGGGCPWGWSGALGGWSLCWRLCLRQCW
jgi:hypothetical protein